MALRTKKEFATACGISTRELSVYVGREKIVLTGNKIDDTLPENIEFMQRKGEKADRKDIEIIVKPSPKTKEEKAEFESKVKRAKEAERRSSLNSQIKELEIKKTQEEVEILRAKREKLEAYLIPTEVVKMIFAQHTKSIVVSFQQGGENLLIEISKKKS